MNVLRGLFRLRRNEKKTREEIIALQKKRLCKLLHYAWDRSPYYRKAFEDAGITEAELDNCDLNRLPIMDKQTFMENFDRIITTDEVSQEMLRRFDAGHPMSDKVLPGGYHIVHSSGSTGKPQYFLYDGNAWQEMLFGIVRGALWGLDFFQILKLLAGGIRILYIAATDGRYGGVMSINDGVLGLGGKCRTLDINEPLREWEHVIAEYDPNVIIAYPSAFKILARLLEESEITLRLKRIITCGEPLPESLREYLENRFGQRIVNFYGASESLALGVETDSKDGMILFDDLNIIECRENEILLTCLYNFAQPIIRYRLHDRLLLREPEGLPAFTRARGQVFRDEDVLWFENGAGEKEYLHPLSIEGFCADGLLDFQFIQTCGDGLTMLAQASDQTKEVGIRKTITPWVKTILLENGLSNVKFDIRLVDHIPPDPVTGKKKLVISL